MIISTLIIIYKCIIIIIELYYFYLDLLSFPVSSTIFLFTRVNSYYSVPQICTFILVTKEISMSMSFGILRSMIISQRRSFIFYYR